MRNAIAEKLAIYSQSISYEALLVARNSFSRRPVAGGAGPVVSMTSYGKRLQRVFLALESIGRASLLPSRLLLWIDDPATLADPPPTLRRLQARGLEILATADYGPHKKYYPYLNSTSVIAGPLVIADDDVYYDHRWLEGLSFGHRSHPDDVISTRARWVGLSRGEITPYATWGRAPLDVASPRVFPTGVGGVLYPVPVLRAIRDAGDGFVRKAPRADDVWLHASTLRSAHVARQVRSSSRFEIVPIRGAGDGLWETNVEGGGNDVQIRNSYGEVEISHLRAAAVFEDDPRGG